MRRTALLAAGGTVLAIVAAVVWSTRAARSGSAEAARDGEPVARTIPAPDRLDDLDGAIAAAVRRGLAAVSRDQEDPAAWTMLARTYAANGMAGLAGDCELRLLELRPGDLPAWYRLALARAEQGRLDAACSAMERAIALHDGHAPAHLRLGFWRLDLDDVDGAEQAFSRAAAIEPGDPVVLIGQARIALRRGRWAPAIGLLQPVASGDGPNAPHARQLLASAYRQAGRLDEAGPLAAAGFGPLQLADPWVDDEGAAGLIASLRDAGGLLARGEDAQAAAAAEQLVAEHQDDVALLTAAGATLRGAGRLQRSEAVLRQAVAIRGTYYPAQLELARTLAARPDADREAREHVDRALALNPTFGPAHALRGELLLRGGDPAGAAEAFAQASRCLPGDWRQPLQAGAAWMRAGDWQAAITWLEQAVTQRPGLGRAHYLLGSAYLNAGRLDEADRELTLAEKLDPGDTAIQAARRQLDAARSRP